MRQEYAGRELRKKEIDERWDRQLGAWIEEAKKQGVVEPNAMVLASAEGGMPAVRTVLLKDLSPEGIVFFTNRESRKGKHLKSNPNVALCFSWPEIERQVTIRGVAHEVNPEVADNYWRERPRESQLGSLISRQSQVAKNREEIEKAMQEAEARIGESIERPEEWTGFRVKPNEIEFWQGGKGRLHNRIRLRETRGGEWVKERLWP